MDKQWKSRARILLITLCFELLRQFLKDYANYQEKHENIAKWSLNRKNLSKKANKSRNKGQNKSMMTSITALGSGALCDDNLALCVEWVCFTLGSRG